MSVQLRRSVRTFIVRQRVCIQLSLRICPQRGYIGLAVASHVGCRFVFIPCRLYVSVITSSNIN